MNPLHKCKQKSIQKPNLIQEFRDLKIPKSQMQIQTRIPNKDQLEQIPVVLVPIRKEVLEFSQEVDPKQE